MVATFLGLLTALALMFGRHVIPEYTSEVVLPDTMLSFFFGLSLFFSLLPWVWTIFSTSGTKNTPATLAPLRSCVWDRRMYRYSIGIQILSFLGIVVVSQDLLPPIWGLALSIVYIGGILDLLKNAYIRLQYRRTASGVAEWFIESMKEAVQKRDARLHTIIFEMIFSTIVDYMHCGLFGSLKTLCQDLLTETDLWIGAIAGLRLYSVPTEQEETMLDRYMIAEAKTAKRLMWVAREACDLGTPIAFEESVLLTGKLFLAFHAHHESLGFILLVSLSQTAQTLDGKIDPMDREVEVTIGFSEVIKSLIDRSIDRRVSDKASILKVLAILETHVKASFHHEKSINPALLMQPFAEIGQMLAFSRYAALPDREEILAQLRRILAQFAAIESVSSRFEMLGPGTDTGASYREDLPFTTPREKPQEPQPRS